MLYATLHAVAAPLWVGLTPALGGEKHSIIAFFDNGSLPASVCSALRTSSRHVATSVTLLAALTHRMRRVQWLRKRCLSCGQWSLRQHPAESSRGALKHLGFGLSVSAPRLDPPRFPSRLTSRSSRRRVVASLKLAGMPAILAPSRRVRRGLTPALGGYGDFFG